MKLATRHFGEIDVNDDEIIDFINGVPGFEGTKYVLLNSSNEELSPFMWLQSVTDGDIALVLVNSFLLYPEYAPDIAEEQLAQLEFNEREDLAVFNVVVIPDKFEDITVNLKAPIIINEKNRKAMQAIADNSDYEIKHPMYDDLLKIVGK